MWAAIETVPVYVLAAFSMQFSHGWYELYPPMQYYLLSLVSSPILLLHSMDVLSYYTPAGLTLLILSYRLLSIMFSVGTVAAVAFAGRLAFGKRAAVLASGFAALGATFVYYAKTANVDMPYVFWYSVSLVFLIRLLQESRVRDYVLFSVTATLAVATKDQAYALYLTVPVIVVYELWRQKRREGASWPLVRAFTDRRIVAAVFAAIGTFVVVFNLIFNFDGFVMHVRATTDAAALYGVFDSTLAGHWQLLMVTIRLVRDSLGWPFFVAALAGIIIGFLTPAYRRTTVWLSAGIPAYYLGLIEIVRYNYDRFMLLGAQGRLGRLRCRNRLRRDLRRTRRPRALQRWRGRRRRRCLRRLRGPRRFNALLRRLGRVARGIGSGWLSNAVADRRFCFLHGGARRAGGRYRQRGVDGSCLRRGRRGNRVLARRDVAACGCRRQARHRESHKRESIRHRPCLLVDLPAKTGKGRTRRPNRRPFLSPCSETAYQYHLYAMKCPFRMNWNDLDAGKAAPSQTQTQQRH